VVTTTQEKDNIDDVITSLDKDIRAYREDYAGLFTTASVNATTALHTRSKSRHFYLIQVVGNAANNIMYCLIQKCEAYTHR